MGDCILYISEASASDAAGFTSGDSVSFFALYPNDAIMFSIHPSSKPSSPRTGPGSERSSTTARAEPPDLSTPTETAYPGVSTFPTTASIDEIGNRTVFEFSIGNLEIQKKLGMRMTRVYRIGLDVLPEERGKTKTRNILGASRKGINSFFSKFAFLCEYIIVHDFYPRPIFLFTKRQ